MACRQGTHPPPHIPTLPFQDLNMLYLLIQIFLYRSCRDFLAFKGWDPGNWFNHTSWVAIVTPNERPKSVRNRCVIEVFGGVFVVTLLLGFFCGCSGFCQRTESDLFLILLTLQTSFGTFSIISMVIWVNWAFNSILVCMIIILYGHVQTFLSQWLHLPLFF